MPTSRRTVSRITGSSLKQGDNDCEARAGASQIGHDRFVAVKIVVGHLSKAARFRNFIWRLGVQPMLYLFCTRNNDGWHHGSLAARTTAARWRVTQYSR